MSKIELIKHASVKSINGWILIGKCHGDCFHKAHAIGVKMSPKAIDQGFVTNQGRFIDRHEGAEIAFKNNQINEPTKALFSEDLWCPAYEGKHTYSEIEGYIPREKE